MVFCPNCGTKNDVGSFCRECGNKLPSPTAAAKEQTSTQVPPTKICPICKKPAGDLLDKIVGKQHYHLDCFNCSECGAYLSETFSMPNPNDPSVLVCPNCKDKHKIKETPKPYEEGGNYFARKVNMSLQINGNASAQSDICVKCGKKIYPNEKLRVMEKNWHQRCFRCTKCNQNLSSFEVINDEPYCRNCFIKLNTEGKTILKEELQ